MSREIDIEIAELDGCNPDLVGYLFEDPVWVCTCGNHQYDDDRDLHEYSSDLNALWALIRRRWPNYILHVFRLESLEVTVILELRENGKVYVATENTEELALAQAVTRALKGEGLGRDEPVR